MTTPTLRTATPHDVEAIVAVVTEAYRGDDTAGWTTESHLLDGQRTDTAEVTAALADTSARVIVAESGGELVGVIKVERRDPDGAGFGLFAVDPTRQSTGAGSLLLDAAERTAGQDWGRAWMQLEVIHQRTELQAWYLRRGYEPTGETVPFPYGDERFGLPRRDDLVFDVFRRPL